MDTQDKPNQRLITPERAREVGILIVAALEAIQAEMAPGIALTLLVRNPQEPPGEGWLISTEPDPRGQSEVIVEEFRLSLNSMTAKGVSQQDLGESMAQAAEHLAARRN